MSRQITHLSPFAIYSILFSILFSTQINGQSKEIRNFIFGHSLIDHRPPAINTPSDETTVPHWVYLLAKEAGHSYSAGGKYGFLQQHDDLPPFAQWGYDIVPGVWDSDLEMFAEADINTAMITAANFAQWQGPNEEYYPPGSGDTPISTTLTIADWLSNEEEGIGIYIYENWPDMAGFIAGEGFPPTTEEFQNYNEYTLGAFHDWWIEYHDALMSSRPDLKIRMIPVGPIIAKVYSKYLSDISISELYEDNAPHGRPNIYFLAALSTYMAFYAEKAPSTYDVPDIIDARIRSDFTHIIDFIWSELVGFNDEGGVNRVFFDTQSLSTDQYFPRLSVNPNPATDYIQVESSHAIKSVKIFDMFGRIQGISRIDKSGNVDIRSLVPGLYLLSVGFADDSHIFSYRVVKI